jgi:ppGpp synthetase/RelA/SpoT-type nucleotidyltranferase
MTELEYKQLLRPLIRAVRQLLTEIDFFLEDISPINVFSITSRLKDYGSATRKARQLGVPVENLQDLAGIRVVVAAQGEVDVVARFFHRGKESDDLKVEADQRLSRKSGYRARHIIVVMKPRYTRSVHPARIEIQLMTVLQHAFNFMSRAWVYRLSCSLPSQWQSGFRDLGKGLRGLDRLAGTLHAEVMKSASSLDDMAALTPISYQQLVKKVFGEDLSLDDAIDSCRFMVDLGCRTNGAVRSFFEDDSIEQLRQKFRTVPGRAAALRGLAETKHTFWLMWGTHYEGAMKFLDELGQS